MDQSLPRPADLPLGLELYAAALRQAHQLVADGAARGGFAPRATRRRASRASRTLRGLQAWWDRDAPLWIRAVVGRPYLRPAIDPITGRRWHCNARERVAIVGGHGVWQDLPANYLRPLVVALTCARTPAEQPHPELMRRAPGAPPERVDLVLGIGVGDRHPYRGTYRDRSIAGCAGISARTAHRGLHLFRPRHGCTCRLHVPLMPSFVPPPHCGRLPHRPSPGAPRGRQHLAIRVVRVGWAEAYAAAAAERTRASSAPGPRLHPLVPSGRRSPLQGFRRDPFGLARSVDRFAIPVPRGPPSTDSTGSAADDIDRTRGEAPRAPPRPAACKGSSIPRATSAPAPDAIDQAIAAIAARGAAHFARGR